MKYARWVKRALIDLLWFWIVASLGLVACNHGIKAFAEVYVAFDDAYNPKGGKR